MKPEEKEVQQALGTLNKYSTLCMVEVSVKVKIPFTVDSMAVNKPAARRAALRRLKKMTPEQRYSYVCNHTDREEFEVYLPGYKTLFEDAIMNNQAQAPAYASMETVSVKGIFDVTDVEEEGD